MEKLSEERKQEIRSLPSFKRFEELVGKVLKVPKEEVDSLEKEAKPKSSKAKNRS